MKYRRFLFMLAASAALCASCVDELSQTEYKPHQARPMKEMMRVEVIATIDNLDKADTEALAPEDYPNMQTLWKWDEGDVAYAVYEVDGTTDVCETSRVDVDPSDAARATLTFETVPVDAAIVAIEVGTPGSIGRRIPCGTALDKSMTWLRADIECEAGEKIISDVVLRNRCAILRVDAGKVSMSGLDFEVSELKIEGKGIFNGSDTDSITLDMEDAAPCLLAVSREATDVSVVASISAGDKQIAAFPSFSTMPMLCRVEDNGDNTEKIEVKVSVTLDAASMSLAKTMSADLSSRTPQIWEWDSSDVLVAEVLVGGVSGSVKSDGVMVDAADANKAVFTFSQMPATAKVTALVFGSPSAFGTMCSAGGYVTRDMMYARADVTSAIGATSISGVDMKHQCSYLNVFADKVEVDEVKYDVPSYSVSGVGLKGDGQAAAINVTNTPGAADSLWIAVSAATSTLQVVANTEVSGAMIFNLPSLGGVSNLFKVRPGETQKVSYRTVLYSDGTFIINEMSINTLMNISLHGDAVEEYAALTDSTGFDFKTAADVVWASRKSQIKAVRFGSATQPSTMAFWFSDAANLESFDSSNLNLSNCRSFNSTFMNCAKLSDIDVSMWDMSAATNCCNMFDACGSIVSLNTSSWNTSKVTDMHFMFRNCSKLQTLDVSGWDVSKVTTFKFTFQACSALTVLDVSKWTTSSVNDIQGIFRDCTTLKELDVAGWDVSKVTTMFQTFYGLKITALDISGWNMACVTNYENFCSGSNKLVTIDMSGCDLRTATSVTNMFRNCSSLETIYANDKCNLTGLPKDKSKGMFYKCVKLRGGRGTMLSNMVVSNNESDDVSAIKYARVDKEGEPGLFTEKQ